MIFKNSYVYPMSYPSFHFIICFIDRVRNHNQNSVLLCFIFIFPYQNIIPIFRIPMLHDVFMFIPIKHVSPCFAPYKVVPPPSYVCWLINTMKTSSLYVS